MRSCLALTRSDFTRASTDNGVRSSATQLGLLKDLASQTDTILLVLNKADRMAAEEERRQARDFTARVLAEEVPGKTPRFFEVSAAERLAGTGPQRDWPALLGALEDLAEESGSSLVRSAERRALALLSERLRHQVIESRDALVRPIEETQRRVETLRGCVAEAQQSLRDLSYLFDSEQDRMGQAFEKSKSEFLERVLPAARETWPECFVHRRFVDPDCATKRSTRLKRFLIGG